jgi:hypothetical protein
MIPPTSVSLGVRYLPLFSRGSTARPRDILEEHVYGIRCSRGVALLRSRCSGSLGGFLILHSLVHQLFDAPITQHNLHQRAFRLPLLGISEREFDSVKMETVVVGFGGMVMTPGVPTRRLA